MTNKLNELLAQLVAIPSVNNAHSDDVTVIGEEKIAKFASIWLQALGFSTQLDYVEPRRPNLVAWYGSKSAKHILLFESHLDTVAVQGMKHDPFSGSIQGGRLYGRGSSDCKGAMAAVFYALSCVDLEAYAKQDRAIIFLGAMGEETGNQGAIDFVKHEPVLVQQTIILEPTDLAIVHTHKGVLWYRIVLHGRSAHGSNPGVGVSAVEAAVRVIEHLMAQIKQDQQKHSHPVLGEPTLNIGRIEGGAAVNIVPVECRLEIDRRVVPGEYIQTLLEQARLMLERLRKEGVVLDYELEVLQENAPFYGPVDSSLVTGLIAQCEPAGVPPVITGAGWCSDAAILSAISDETIVFGPGSIKQAHASEEFISLDELQRSAEMLRGFLADTKKRPDCSERLV